LGGGSGSSLQGLTKLIPTHPFSPSIGNAAANNSKFEGLEQSVNPTTGALTNTDNYFPRAIIDRSKIINSDFMMPVTPIAGGGA
jgi:hypothetical protein